ncbi:MAG: DUF3450 family protein [Fibrobacterota bacterium]
MSCIGLGRHIPILLCCCMFAAASAEQSVEDIKSEIKNVRAQLVEVREENSSVVDKIDDDRREFKEYRDKILEKIRTVEDENDSLDSEIRDLRLRRDSLGGVLAGKKRSQRSYEILQKNLSREMADAAKELKESCTKLSPSLREKPVSAADLLISELESGNVDNVEALTRLFQIARDVANSSFAIEIAQGRSPVPELRGTIYKIRIGTLMDAAVNMDGTKAAVWQGRDENGKDMWEMVESKDVAAEILKAVNVREGKSLPDLVSLKFPALDVVKKGYSDDK